MVVRDVPEDAAQQQLELALIENIQRENLNAIEESLGYQRLTDEFGLTQEQIAAAVGKDRSTVANLLRLLRLPQEIRAELSSERLTVGHARALLSLPEAADQKHVAREVISRSLSVRETEALVKRMLAPARQRRRQCCRRPGRRPHSVRPRSACASLWGRKCRSSGAARAAPSRSPSGPRPS